MRRTSRQSKNEGMWQVYAALGVLALAIIAFLSTLPFNTLEVKRLVVTYSVGEKAGFDLNATALSYGRLLPGSKGTRIVNVDNTFDFPIHVTFRPHKDINSLLSFNRTRQTIAPGGNLTLPITLLVPVDAPFGNHTSFIVVKIRK